MRKLLLVLAIMAFMVTTTSSAYAFDLGGYVGKILIKISGYANGNAYQQGQAATTYTNNTGSNGGYGDGTEDGWGVGLVTDIYKINVNGTKGDRIWADGQNNESLAYLYYGIDDWKVSTVDPRNSYIYSVGGMLDMYVKPFGSVTLAGMNASQRTATDAFTTITDGTKFARYDFVPGIKTGDAITSTSERIAYSQFANGVFGSGASLADIDGANWGIYSNYLNTNGQKNGTDLSLGFTVSFNPGATVNGFAYSVDDPGRTAVAPEPVSSALFLMGGVALAARQLRRKNKKA